MNFMSWKTYMYHEGKFPIDLRGKKLRFVIQGNLALLLLKNFKGKLDVFTRHNWCI